MGIYLTLPLARSMRDKRGARAHYPTASFWSRWRSDWRMPVGTRGVRPTFDLHGATGLWTAGAALLLALSGASLNLANEIVMAATGLLISVTPFPLITRPRLKAP